MHGLVDRRNGGAQRSRTQFAFRVRRPDLQFKREHAKYKRHTSKSLALVRVPSIQRVKKVNKS
jgi:hypothetical protein